MELIRGVVFDLDDTLYFERDYVTSGFRYVASTIARDRYPAEGLFQFLQSGFDAGMRGDAFDRLIAEYPELGLRYTVADLVEMYRSHPPKIQLLPEILHTIKALTTAGLRLALITDGHVAGQSAKISALELDKWFAPIFITDAWGIEFRKPHPRAYEAVMDDWDIPARHLAYIGDNPEKDFYAPRILGWHTARLRLEKQLRHALGARSPEFAAEREFCTLSNFASWLYSACALRSREGEDQRTWQLK